MNGGSLGSTTRVPHPWHGLEALQFFRGLKIANADANDGSGIWGATGGPEVVPIRDDRAWMPEGCKAERSHAPERFIRLASHPVQ